MVTMPRPATKRDDIIRVARRLFAEHGVKATTVREIAQAAGVTEGALYRHFESKSDLARYLFAGGAELFYAYLDEAVAGVEEAERLRALVCGFFDFAESNPEVFGFVMARHYGGVGELPPAKHLPKALFVATLAAGMEAGRLRRLDHELAAALVIGMCVQSIFFLQRGLVEQSAVEARNEVCAAVNRVFAI
jgi:AcrR family transcriptional regulator